MNVEARPESVSLTRNSPLREMTEGPIGVITEKLHKAFPDLTANDITIFGLIGTGIGATSATLRRGDGSVRDKTLTYSSFVTLLGSQLCDVFDGPMARLRNAEDPKNANPHGEYVDVTSDRLGELFLALSRAISADKRKSSLGTIAALTTAVTSPFPSIARAYKESSEIEVPEGGRGVMGLFGTRFGRAILGIFATVYPEIKGVPVQVIADGLSTAANIITAEQRLHIKKNDTEKFPSETQHAAKKRLKLLGVIGVGSAIAAGATYLLLRKK
jgi:phosphatidylglycerophosphate synthase